MNLSGRRRPRKRPWQSLLIVGFLSVVFGVLGLGFDGVMREIVGAKGEVVEMGSDYLRVVLARLLDLSLLQLSIQRALGSSKTPVVLSGVANMINIVLAISWSLDPTRLRRSASIPRMGTVGAAWATLGLAQVRRWAIEHDEEG